jgi:hypothetical protein
MIVWPAKYRRNEDNRNAAYASCFPDGSVGGICIPDSIWQITRDDPVLNIRNSTDTIGANRFMAAADVVARFGGKTTHHFQVLTQAVSSPAGLSPARLPEVRRARAAPPTRARIHPAHPVANDDRTQVC